MTSPHVDVIAWGWSTPRPSRLDPLAAPDLATGLAHAREQAEDYRHLALTAIAELASLTATTRRLETALAAARDEIRRLRGEAPVEPLTSQPTRDPEYMRQVYAYLRDEGRS